MSNDLERRDHLLEQAVAELKAQYEALLAADEELRAQMEALHDTSACAVLERERYFELFECTPLATIIADRAGVIIAANRAAQTLFGVEERRLRGRSFASLVHPADAARIRDATQAPRHADEELSARIRRVRGAEFEGVVTATFVERGRRLLLTVRAVANIPTASLDANVAALTRTLRDKEELFARERALRAQLEKTDRAKDRFIAILSHDLRGPINSVLGWTQLLRREQLASDARDRALETIERATRAQLGLVEELLDLSRITADKMVLEVAPLDLALTVERIVESHVPTANEAALSLEADITEASATIFGDRKRVTQIVSNLLSNAIKFTPPGGRIRVRVFTEGVLAVLEVEDSGQGVKPEVLPELFECFRQGCTAATARAGLGLGLYIVKQLVQLHGGTVEAKSPGEGRGTSFTVRFPLRETTPALASETMLPDESTTDLDGVRVLVVEDEPDTRELMTTMLAGKGANVSAASDASQALAMFESWSPDVVVSDIEMPGDDGCALIRRIRTRASHVPAIAVSGFAATKDAERALDAGFDVHVPKPVEPRELVRRIRELSASRPRRP